MDTLPDTPRSATDGRADEALLWAVADMSPGWTVLRDCALAGSDQGTPARVRYALLHPDFGIALLDVLPGTTTPGAPDRLRQSLDAVGFRPAFGDYPPIVYLCVPPRSLSGLGPLLAREFDQQAPLALVGDDAWIVAAQRVLATESPQCVPGPADIEGRPLPIRPPERGQAEGRPAPLQNWGWRALAAFWTVAGLALSGSVLILHYLGPPPDDHPAIAHAGAAGPGEPQAASEPRPMPSLIPYPDKAWRPPPPGPFLALWSAERMVTRLEAAREASGETVPVEPRAVQDSAAPVAAGPGAPQRPLAAASGHTEAGAAAPAQVSAPNLAQSGVAEASSVASGEPSVPADPRTTRSRDEHAGADAQPRPATAAASVATALAFPSERPSNEMPTALLQEPSALAGIGMAEPNAALARGTVLGVLPAPGSDLAATAPLQPAIPAEARDSMGAGIQPSPSARVAAASRSSALAEVLIARGDAMVARRDISAARLLYERAAMADARAAAALARTYDPAFLAETGAQGIRGDTALATAWYRKAASLGDGGALARAEALTGPDRAAHGRP